MRRIASASALLALVVAVAGCSSDDTITGPVTEINGEVPPGELAPLVDTTSLIDTVDADGKQIIVTRGTRLPGTRVGIHVHEHGGYTCVLSGTITDFVEGKEPSVWPAGTCYFMPANTPMTAANLGDEPAVLIDNFVIPEGAPPITILEPGWDEAVAAYSND